MRLLSIHKKLITENGEVSLSSLSDVEFSIFLLLIKSYPHVLSREAILEQCWAGKVVTDNSINVAISNIRSCLGGYGLSGLILTERGMGYKTSNKIILEETDEIKNEKTKKSFVFTMKIFKEEKAVHFYYMFFINVLMFILIIFMIRAYIQASLL